MLLLKKKKLSNQKSKKKIPKSARNQNLTPNCSNLAYILKYNKNTNAKSWDKCSKTVTT